ncbi:hypothetical protein ACFQ46_23055 [Kineococcus sp. GCM10028916]|uniref:hypothetical protein n=1 Tax=Kineococcus sp. GCM10028916 TaxID=3273394 RepID=UPI00362FBFC9
MKNLDEQDGPVPARYGCTVLGGEDVPRLTACLIVRDEEPRIRGTLASLDGLDDEVIVHDTGSLDRTVAFALEAGAVVVEGS